MSKNIEKSRDASSLLLKNEKEIFFKKYPKLTKEMLPREILKFYRLKRNLTQRELAWEIGRHQSYIGVMERGIKGISKEKAEKLGEILGVEKDKLISKVKKSTYNPTN